MKNNHASLIASAMDKLEVLNAESSKNIVGGKITITITITITK